MNQYFCAQSGCINESQSHSLYCEEHALRDPAWPQPTGQASETVTRSINEGIRRRLDEANTGSFTPPKVEAPQLKEPYPVTAAGILQTAAQHMQERAATYDQPQGERSISKTVAMFNALTGDCLTDEQGWLFMTCLKMVRAQAGRYRADSYEDGAAYFALAGESAAQERV